MPHFPVDYHETLSRDGEDVLQYWIALENYLDVCKCVEHIGEQNNKSIAREFTWEVFKMTEELKSIAGIISDQHPYNYDSKVVTGLELCTETVDFLISHYLTTEEVSSCTSSISSYHYFSEIHSFDQALNLLRLLKGYSVLLKARDLKLQYQFLLSNYSDEDDFYDEEIYIFVSIYLKEIQQYFHLCPSHPDFKVALGMLAHYFKVPTFSEWAEELQTDLPINDSLSLFLDSQSAGGSTAMELMHESRNRFQDNYVMNRTLVAKCVSLIPNEQPERLDELLENQGFETAYPLLVADIMMKAGLCIDDPDTKLRYLRKAATMMEPEPKLRNKCAKCYAKQVEVLVKNEGSQLEIERLMWCARDSLKDLDLEVRGIFSSYVSARRFADLEHFILFSTRIFQNESTLPVLGTLASLYEQRPIDHFMSRCFRTR